MKKRKNTLMWVSIASFSIMLVAGIVYQIIGQTIDSQGYLQEPFALIPIGWLFFFLGVVTGLLYLVSHIVQHFHKIEK
jgi:hypothetical protein